MIAGQTPYRGTVAASAVILDTPRLGQRIAAGRAMTLWQSGSSLRTLPDGRWLLILPRAQPMRAERAPGLPLQAHTASYAPAGIPAPTAPATAAIPISGRIVEVNVTQLPHVDLAGWITPPPTRVTLTPLDAPPPAPVTPTRLPRTPSPDVRRRARIGQRSARADRAIEGMTKTTAKQRSSRLAQLVVRTNPAGVIGRRQARFVQELTDAFAQHRWDDALRDAIGLGDSAALSLRLPRRSGSLQPHPVMTSGRGLPVNPTVRHHLQTLYRTAAGQLEAEGRTLEAAFVFSDLLNSPSEAISLLERHRQWQLAAELAEGRKLPPELAVRLWWQAGDRRRAITIARTRGAFAAAIERLTPTDPHSARELRRAWIEQLTAAEHHLAAVQAAWPDPELRPDTMTALTRGIALGGPTAAELHAYLLAVDPTDTAIQTARQLITNTDNHPNGRAKRDAFIRQLTRVDGIEAAVDRELTSLALLGALTNPPARSGNAADTDLRALRQRADPLVVADLPSKQRKPATPPALTVRLPDGPGPLTVHDAAHLGSSLLLACGEAGTRLLTLDGRTRARWDTPAHLLSVADSGNVALIAARRGHTLEVSRLNVATRQVRPWTTLATRFLAPSFDGSILITADGYSLSFIDTLTPTPRLLWRELDAGTQHQLITRTPTHLTALVISAPQAYYEEVTTELWKWQLPTITLRGRPRIDPTGASEAVLLATDGLVTAEATTDQVATVLHRHDADGKRPIRTIPIPAEQIQLLSSADDWGLLNYDEAADTTHLRLHDGAYSEPWAHISTAGRTTIGMRRHAHTLTLWTPDGRVLALDSARRGITAAPQIHI